MALGVNGEGELLCFLRADHDLALIFEDNFYPFFAADVVGDLFAFSGNAAYAPSAVFADRIVVAGCYLFDFVVGDKAAGDGEVANVDAVCLYGDDEFEEKEEQGEPDAHQEPEEPDHPVGTRIAAPRLAEDDLLDKSPPHEGSNADDEQHDPPDAADVLDFLEGVVHRGIIRVFVWSDRLQVAGGRFIRVCFPTR